MSEHSSFSPAPFRPYVPPEQELAELTVPAVVVGAVMGIVFGASSLYLVLKVGMTVSASIPVAVLSITLFRGISRRFKVRQATILENNIVQTTGSAGESIAFGVGVTMPALLILGFDLEAVRVMMVACLGGLLGILMMIPLRRAFIVQQHGRLPYPEGTACAQVLIVGEKGGTSARTVFFGFGLAFAYQTLMQALALWREEVSARVTSIQGYDKANLSCGVEPALLGVGYIIGPRIASITVSGGLLAALVLTPMIAYFGSLNTTPLPPAVQPIPALEPSDIAGTYVRYIGAGAVAMGGFISMIRVLPLIVSSVAGGLRDLRRSDKVDSNEVETQEIGRDARPRTERDLPMTVVFLGALGLVAAIAASDLIPTAWPGRIVGGGLIVLLGFLFVTVSSRLTGEIGSSSNPISGMTIATLLVTCLVFSLLGWIGDEYRLAALCIAGIVCIASSNGGTTSQDLKTGHLVGATPWTQQVAIAVGSLTSALVIGFTLLMLNQVNTVVSAKAEYLPTSAAVLPAPTELEQTYLHNGRTYKLWVVTTPREGVEPGRYLIDPETGVVAYRVDPAFSKRITTRDDGSKVEKFTPPQASLFATIIDGIMKGELAWGLVVIGAMIAVIAQLCGVSALPFAVGVYLPLATTMPIFVGGMTRAWVERRRAQMEKAAKSPEESDSDTSPGVLMSSGLIAGGAIAGILIAFLSAVPSPSWFSRLTGLPEANLAEATLRSALSMDRHLPAFWTESHLPALLMFLMLVTTLVLVATEKLLRK